MPASTHLTESASTPHSSLSDPFSRTKSQPNETNPCKTGSEATSGRNKSSGEDPCIVEARNRAGLGAMIPHSAGADVLGTS